MFLPLTTLALTVHLHFRNINFVVVIDYENVGLGLIVEDKPTELSSMHF